MNTRHANIRPLQIIFTIAALIIIDVPDTVTCFSACTPFVHRPTSQGNIINPTPPSRTRLAATESMNDDVSRQLAKARELLELSKAKLAAQEEAGDPKDAVEQNRAVVLESSEMVDEKRLRVTKSTDDESGLITTDGELMAMLSEEEVWEVRDLFDVFEDELEESDVSKQLAKRDVAASIVGLRISMHNDDYKKIFNTRNRWIGEY